MINYMLYHKCVKIALIFIISPKCIPIFKKSKNIHSTHIFKCNVNPYINLLPLEGIFDEGQF